MESAASFDFDVNGKLLGVEVLFQSAFSASGRLKYL
jgi:hypothetical protein